MEHTSLSTVSVASLMETEMPALLWIVDGLLPEGLGVIGAPPKSGKSFFCYQLCLAVAAGEPFLSAPTHKADTLYLALEDGFRRLQDRAGMLLSGPAPDNCHVAVEAGTMDTTLPVQIDNYMKEHPLTGLIVIDLYNKVRSTPKGQIKDIYQYDSHDPQQLKALADKHHICILVVHHTRKQRDADDVFNDLSGSQGLFGAADCTMILKRERADNSATLHVTGREVEENSWALLRDPVSCRWSKVGSVAEVQRAAALTAFKASPLVQTVAVLAGASPSGVQLTAQELRNEMIKTVGVTGEQDTPSKVGRFINDNRSFFAEIGIEYSFKRDGANRYHVFKKH